MNPRTATLAEWKELVINLRAQGRETIATMLEAGQIESFDLDGTTLRCPFASSSTATSAPAWNGKSWGELAPREKHELRDADPSRFEQMRSDWHTWNGKTYAELDDDERVALYRADRARFVRLFDKYLIDERNDHGR